MLVPDQYEMQLGDLEYGKTYKFKYKITNNATSTANLVKLKTGCGKCTTANIGVSKIEPGKTITMDVAYTPDSTGSIKKNVSLFYETDTIPLTLVVSFRGNVSGQS